jgi:hypothetical protein
MLPNLKTEYLEHAIYMMRTVKKHTALRSNKIMTGGLTNAVMLILNSETPRQTTQINVFIIFHLQGIPAKRRKRLATFH